MVNRLYLFWAVAIGVLTPLPRGQEPWYEPGPHPWGHRYHEGTFLGDGVAMPLRLVFHYPAEFEGLDAPLLDAEAPYPVVFFQHAGGSDYDQYDYLFSKLASRGFVVVSGDHDHAGTWGSWGSDTYAQKHVDLFHEMIRLTLEWSTAIPGSFLFGGVDSERMALAGHSHGCFSALEAMKAYRPVDPEAELEIRCISMLAPCPLLTTSVSVIDTYPSLFPVVPPLQVIYGARDTDGCVALGQSIGILEIGDSPRQYVYVEGADHYAFTDSGGLGASTITREEAQRAAGTATIAYLEHMLQGDGTALPYLAHDLPLLEGAPEVTYQFRPTERLVIDDFEDLEGGGSPTVAIASFGDGVFINGFLSDAFVDVFAGIELVRQELQRIYPAVGMPPFDVLYYEDATLGLSSVYEAALHLEVAAGNVNPFTRLTSSSIFAADLQAGSGDFIISAHQGAPGAQPHDGPLQVRLCAGTPALITDWRNLPSDGSAGSEPALACVGAGYEGQQNFTLMTPTGDLFPGPLALWNPGWGKSTVDLTTTDAVHAVTEHLTGAATGDPFTTSLGLGASASGFDAFVQQRLFDPGGTLYHPTGGLELAWSAPGAVWSLDLGGLDARGFEVLSLRVTQLRDDPLNPAGGQQDLTLRLRDGAGAQAELPLSSAAQGALAYPFQPAPGIGSKSVLETYRWPLARFLELDPTLDLGDLRALELVFDRTPSGRLAFDDLELVPVTVPVASATARAPCTAAAPARSLVPAGPLPLLGTVFEVDVDDPDLTAGLTPGALTLWALAWQPAPGFPCGPLLGGFGSGGPGELLIAAPALITSAQPWSPGSPARHSVILPPLPTLAGAPIYTQALFLDPGPAGLVLTEGLDLIVGI